MSGELSRPPANSVSCFLVGFRLESKQLVRERTAKDLRRGQAAWPRLFRFQILPGCQSRSVGTHEERSEPFVGCLGALFEPRHFGWQTLQISVLTRTPLKGPSDVRKSKGAAKPSELLHFLREEWTGFMQMREMWHREILISSYAVYENK